MLKVVCVQSPMLKLSYTVSSPCPWKQAKGIRDFSTGGNNASQHILRQESHFFHRIIQDNFRQDLLKHLEIRKSWNSMPQREHFQIFVWEWHCEHI